MRLKNQKPRFAGVFLVQWRQQFGNSVVAAVQGCDLQGAFFLMRKRFRCCLAAAQ
jgi:hypothetical protein